VLVGLWLCFCAWAFVVLVVVVISVVLENSLWDGRFLLPFRQDAEIRRRTTWLDFPARGIIRLRWEIGDYEFNQPIDPSLFGGPPIGGLRVARNDDSTRFGGSLDSAVASVAEPLSRQEMEALRVEVERIAGTRALGGLASKRLAARSVSDIVKINRVQGLTLGFGATLGSSESRFQARPYAAYGTSDDRLLGSLALSMNAGSTRISAEGFRRIRDFSDLPIITPLFNSITSQEFAKDYGDYVLLEGASLGVRHPARTRRSVRPIKPSPGEVVGLLDEAEALLVRVELPEEALLARQVREARRGCLR
jgi:hypothetical protein